MRKEDKEALCDDFDGFRVDYANISYMSVTATLDYLSEMTRVMRALGYGPEDVGSEDSQRAKAAKRYSRLHDKVAKDCQRFFNSLASLHSFSAQVKRKVARGRVSLNGENRYVSLSEWRSLAEKLGEFDDSEAMIKAILSVYDLNDPSYIDSLPEKEREFVREFAASLKPEEEKSKKPRKAEKPEGAKSEVERMPEIEELPMIASENIPLSDDDAPVFDNEPGGEVSFENEIELEPSNGVENLDDEIEEPDEDDSEDSDKNDKDESDGDIDEDAALEYSNVNIEDDSEDDSAPDDDIDEDDPLAELHDFDSDSAPDKEVSGSADEDDYVEIDEDDPDEPEDSDVDIDEDDPDEDDIKKNKIAENSSFNFDVEADEDDIEPVDIKSGSDLGDGADFDESFEFGLEETFEAVDAKGNPDEDEEDEDDPDEEDIEDIKTGESSAEDDEGDIEFVDIDEEYADEDGENRNEGVDEDSEDIVFQDDEDPDFSAQIDAAYEALDDDEDDDDEDDDDWEEQ